MGQQYVMDEQPSPVDPHVDDVNFNRSSDQVEDGVDLKNLADELSRLGAAMVAAAVGSEKWAAADVVLWAGVEAQKGNGPRVLDLLSKANNWALETASTIGTKLAVDALKVALGVCTPKE